MMFGSMNWFSHGFPAALHLVDCVRASRGVLDASRMMSAFMLCARTP